MKTIKLSISLLLVVLFSICNGQSIQGRLVKCGKDDPKVWWVDAKNVMHHVSGQAALTKYWSWNDVKIEGYNYGQSFLIGPSVTEYVHPNSLVGATWSMEPYFPSQGRLVRLGSESPRVWWIDAHNILHHVINSEALTKYWSWNDVKVESYTFGDTFQVGPSIR